MTGSKRLVVACVATACAGFLWFVARDAAHEPAAAQLEQDSYHASLVKELPTLRGLHHAHARARVIRCTIRCEDHHGAGVAGALVRAWRVNYPRTAEAGETFCGSWLTTDQGEVTASLPIDGIPSRPSYGCRFEAVHPTVPGLVVHHRIALGGGFEPPLQRITLSFDPLARGVEGAVSDEAGNPVSGALVDWTDASGQGTATLRNRSAKDGRYAISAGERPGTHLRFQSRFHHPVVVAVEPGQATLDVVMRLRPHVVGRIVDEEGRPIRGARVSAIVMGEAAVGSTPRPPQSRWDHWLKHSAYSESGPRGGSSRTWAYRRTVETDDGGHFSQPFLVSGTTRIVVKCEGYELLVRDVEQPHGPAVDYEDVVLRRSALRGRSGRLIDSSGLPIPDAQLIFVRPPLDETQVLLGTVRTDAEGHFSLDGLPLGIRAHVSILAPGKGRGQYRQMVEIHEDLVIEY